MATHAGVALELGIHRPAAGGKASKVNLMGSCFVSATVTKEIEASIIFWFILTLTSVSGLHEPSDGSNPDLVPMSNQGLWGE